MITTFNYRKLLEKQRVQNAYEVHIGRFLYNVNATVSFGNRLIFKPVYIQISTFFTGRACAGSPLQASVQN